MLTAAFETRWIDWRGEAVEVVADRWIFQAPAGRGLDELVAVLPFGATNDAQWRLRSLGNDAFAVTATGSGAGDVAAWVEMVGATQLMPDFVFRGGVMAVPSDLPNDPDFTRQLALRNWGPYAGFQPGADVNVVEGWHHTTGSRDAVVAIIDTGLDYRHPDLIDNIWTNPGEIPGDGIDNDGNGYVDDVHGYDFFYDDGDPAEYLPLDGVTAGFGHGTLSAGIVGAVGNNSLAVSGVAWQVSLMGLKVFSNDGSQTAVSFIVEAINYVTMMKQRGVNVVATNNSYGGKLTSTTPDDLTNPYRAAIDAGGAEGILFVAAAGNTDGSYEDWFVGLDSDRVPVYPASVASDFVIAVAASTPYDGLAGFSRYGLRSVDVAAPGTDGWSTFPTTALATHPNGVGAYSGTSMAAPHVAGAIALLATAMPAATPLEIRSAIIDSARRNVYLDGTSVSGGVLDIGAAMRLLASRLGLEIVSPEAVATPENQSFVTIASASTTNGGRVQWSIGGGADQSLFAINAETGALSFREAADFEAPRDADRDNRYEVIVRVVDGAATAAKQLFVTVTDEDETPPRASFDAVPSPRISALDSVGLSFSKEVQGFGLEDLELSREGVTIPLTGITITGSGTAFTVANLAALSTAAGTYTLRLKAAGTGIQDAFGNPLSHAQSVQWTVSGAGGAGRFTTDATWAVPENVTNIGSLRVDGYQVNAVVTFRIVGGIDADRFTLNPVTGELAFREPQDYEASTDADGDGVYAVSVQAGYEGLAVTQVLAVRLTDIDEIQPTVSIRALPPLRQNPVQSIVIDFSEPVLGFSTQAIQLTRNGDLVNLDSVRLAVDDGTYTLEGMGAVTAEDGVYELTIVQPSGWANYIRDAASNPVQRREALWAGFSPRFTQPTGWVLASATWITRNGSVSPPYMVKDIASRGGDAMGYTPTAAFDGSLYFAATNDRAGEELWVSNGSPAGTSLVADLRPGVDLGDSWKSSRPEKFTAGRDAMFFVATIGDPPRGSPEPLRVVWRTDGTVDGTYVVSDAFHEILDLHFHEDTLFFSSWNSDTQSHLWATDGSPDGAVIVSDVRRAYRFTAVGDRAYLSAADAGGRHGEEPHILRAGTLVPEMIADLNTGFQTTDGRPRTSQPQMFTPVGDRVFFKASGESRLQTAAGVTYRMSPGSGSEVDATDFINTYWGQELWVTDGTAVGTYLVKDIAPGGTSSLPESLTAFQGKLLFTADDRQHGRELWVTDGTEDGTFMLSDILPGGSGSDPVNLTVNGDFVYFCADDGIHGRELWRTDGTREGTVLAVDIEPGPSSSSPRSNTRAKGMVAHLTPFVAHSGVMYFTARTSTTGWEVWRSDGTPAGTWLLSDIYAGPMPDAVEQATYVEYGPYNFRAVGDVLYFSANDGVRGRELWRYDLPTWTPTISSPAVVHLPESTTTAFRVTSRYVGPDEDVVYAIVGGEDASRFTIDSRGGVVSFTNPPQVDVPADADGDGIYRIVVQAATGSASSEMAVSIMLGQFTNRAPTAVGFSEAITAITEDTPTAARIKLANIVVMDDGLGVNTITLSGVDAASFEVADGALYLRSGMSLDGVNKPSLVVIVEVRDDSLVASLTRTAVFSLAVLPSGIVVDAGQTMTDDTTHAGDFRLLKRGEGRLVLDRPNTHGGGTRVEAGELIIRNLGALGTGPLEVLPGARVTLDVGFGRVSMPGLIVHQGATIDVGRGGLALPAGSMSAAEVRALLLSGRNGGNWTGAGIGTSDAPAGSRRAVGYRVMPNNSIVVAWAAFGDTNLDGLVNSTDINLILQAGRYQTLAADGGWWQGDFNYDGRVNSSDINLLLAAGLLNKPSYRSTGTAQSLQTTAGDVEMVMTAFGAHEVREEPVDGTHLEPATGVFRVAVYVPSPNPGPSADLDGNGVADLFWQSADGITVAWIDGNPGSARHLGGGGGWTLAATGDLNADGVSDIVWRDPAGIYVAWLMSPRGETLQQQYLGGGDGWELEATGDYDGDAKTDLIWRHDGSGVNVMWLMAGVVPTSQTVVGGNFDWRLVPTEERFDSDGDGRTDLIWRHAASGANILWTMTGGTVTSTRALGGDHTWQIAGATDFDADGKGDLLWRNSSNGGVVMHLMDGGEVRESRFVGGDLSRTVSAATASAIFWRDLGGAIEQQSLATGSSPAAKRIGGNAVWRLMGRPGQVV